MYRFKVEWKHGSSGIPGLASKEAAKQAGTYLVHTKEKHIAAAAAAVAAAATKGRHTWVTRFVRRQNHRFRP